MIDLKVDQLISMTTAQLNLCKTESSSWMTKKVLLKSLMKLIPMVLVSESPPSITCRSLILSRVKLSKEKDNWTLNHPYSISSFSTMIPPPTLSPLRAQTLAQSRSIRLLTPRFNTDCFRWAKTSFERVLRTSPINLMLIGKLSALTSCNLLTSFIKMSIMVHQAQSKSQRCLLLPISPGRPWWTKRSSGRPRNSYPHTAAKSPP